MSEHETTGEAIAVTGAAGKTGRHVIAELRRSGRDVRALIRVTARRAGLPDGVTAVSGDLRDPDALLELVRGCRAVYHIPPNMSAQELVFAQALLDACRRGGVERIVYHSVLHPQLETLPHHWAKLRVEELLLTSGHDVVIVQPAPYLHNLDPYLRTALAGDPLPFPYGAHVVLSMVDLRDVAEVASSVVDGAEHAGGTYQLCGAERLPQGEVWSRASDALGLAQPFRSISLAEWRETAAGSLPDRVADWLGRMFAYYDEHGLVGSSIPLAALLGRPPRTLDDYLASVADADGGP